MDHRVKPGGDEKRKAFVTMTKRRVSKATGSKRKAEDGDPTSRRNRPLFRAACAVVAGKYCDWFDFWRDCRYKPCRSARRCVGDGGTCLNKHWYSLPYQVRLDAHVRMQAEGPPNVDRWLRLAHRYPPDALWLNRPSDRIKAKTPEQPPKPTGKQ